MDGFSGPSPQSSTRSQYFGSGTILCLPLHWSCGIMTNGSFGPGLKEAKVSKTKKMSPKRQLFFISICVDARLLDFSTILTFSFLVSWNSRQNGGFMAWNCWDSRCWWSTELKMGNLAQVNFYRKIPVQGCADPPEFYHSRWVRWDAGGLNHQKNATLLD